MLNLVIYYSNFNLMYISESAILCYLISLNITVTDSDLHQACLVKPSCSSVHGTRLQTAGMMLQNNRRALPFVPDSQDSIVQTLPAETAAHEE